MLQRTLDAVARPSKGKGEIKCSIVDTAFCPSRLTSQTSKVCGFSEVFRHRKTEVAYFTIQFLNNYRLQPYILQAQKIEEARVCLESFKSNPEYELKASNNYGVRFLVKCLKNTCLLGADYLSRVIHLTQREITQWYRTGKICTNHLSLNLLGSRVHIFNYIIFLRAFDFIPARPFLERSSREAECVCHVV